MTFFEPPINVESALGEPATEQLTLAHPIVRIFCGSHVCWTSIFLALVLPAADSYPVNQRV
jgi:hypothetical protein